MSIKDAGYHMIEMGLRSSANVTIFGFSAVTVLPEKSPNRCMVCAVYWIDDLQLMASLLLKRSPLSAIEFIREHGEGMIAFTGRIAPHERYVDQSGLEVMPFTGIMTTLDGASL